MSGMWRLRQGEHRIDLTDGPPRGDEPRGGNQGGYTWRRTKHSGRGTNGPRKLVSPTPSPSGAGRASTYCRGIPMTERTLPSPGDCELIFHAALRAGDAKGVEAALIALAVQDPHRAGELYDLLQIALHLGGLPNPPGGAGG